MDKLRIRMYNVRFGDAFLVSVPDKTDDGKEITRHILIDVGNAFISKDGGDDSVFEPVVKDILTEVGDQGLDLYIMTHEHMDHVQGLLYSNKHSFLSHDLADKLKTHHVWMPISSNPDYSVNTAREKLRIAYQAYDEIARTISAEGGTSVPVETLLAINNPRATADCVDYLRHLSPSGQTWYVYRGVDLSGKHDFHDTSFEIWAPEPDPSIYFTGIVPLTATAQLGGSNKGSNEKVIPIPPRGVDAGAFYNLVESRSGHWTDTLLAIDKAVNNTSIVFCLDWCGRRLLFTGDAEIPSWTKMDEESMLKPVDFLKISHHGSYNGTPPLELLDKILPGSSRLNHPAALSTFDNQYDTIPDSTTIGLIKEHSLLYDIRSDIRKLYVDILLSPKEVEEAIR